MRLVCWLVCLPALTSCASDDDAPAPVRIPACTTCAPGSIAGGTFFPAEPGLEQTLHATPDGTPIRVFYTELDRLDLDLNVAASWTVLGTPLTSVDYAFDDSLASVVTGVRSREAPGMVPPYESQALLEAYAPSGAMRWSVELTPFTRGSVDRGTVALAGDQVVVGGPGGLAAYALADGAHRWATDMPADALAAGGSRLAVIHSPFQAPPTVSVLDLAGAPVFSRTFPLEADVGFSAVDVDDTGRIAVVGARDSTIDLGDGVVLDGPGGFVAVYEPDGMVAWAADFWRASDYELAGRMTGIMLSAEGVALVGEGGLNSSEGLTVWMDASGVRWSAIVPVNASVSGGGVIVRGDRVYSALTLSTPFDDQDPNTEDVTTTTLGGTRLTGTGTAFVSYVR